MKNALDLWYSPSFRIGYSVVETVS